jgi:hypothetical protein
MALQLCDDLPVVVSLCIPASSGWQFGQVCQHLGALNTPIWNGWA